MPEIIRIGGKTYREIRTKRRKNTMHRNSNSYSGKLRELKARRAYESEKSRFRQEQRIRRQQASARRKEKLERYKQKAKAFYNKDVGNPLNRFRKKKEQQPYGGFESAEK